MALQPVVRTFLNSAKKYGNDVTRMNRTRVAGIFYPTNTQDILTVLELARSNGKKVSFAGTHHSMGGHTLNKDGYVIDTSLLDRILKFDEEKKLVTVEPGVKWSEVIHFLNKFGLSPLTLQSYSSFSVGGTVAVNAHGITNDKSMCESVESVRVITPDGKIALCSREINSDLFRHAIGGYGLFGFIDQITLRVGQNFPLHMQMVTTPVDSFSGYYQTVLNDVSVGVKIARINITNWQEVLTTVFRHSGQQPITDDLTPIPKIPPKFAQLVYKWLVPNKKFQKLRFWIEKNILRKPMDVTAHGSINRLLYETAGPMAELYSPLVNIDRTHILQEYFIPKEHFIEWMTFLKSHFTTTDYRHIRLLNITIRYLEKDNTTALPYAKADGMHAFVFYYRIPRTTDATEELETVHHSLVDEALRLSGTFYLPYLHHYSKEQMLEAYPGIDSFFHTKLAYDPRGMFSNRWYEAYATTVPNSLNHHASYVGSSTDPISQSRSSYSSYSSYSPRVSLDYLEGQDASESVEICEPNYYYRKLLSTSIGKYDFEQFLTFVFNVIPARDLMIQLEEIFSQDPNADDHRVFSVISEYCRNRRLNKFRTLGPTLRNLKSQKQEMATETYELLEQLNKHQVPYDGYMSIGDPGRYVNSLNSLLNIQGTTFVVHDRNSLAGMVERGSIIPVGSFVPIDYINVAPINIPSDSVDLATIYIGLHHFTPDGLDTFLKEMYRIIRSNGMFIVRDHNSTPEVEPILHCAHNIYNAVTGETLDTERNEIRHFKTVKEWERILGEYGFASAKIYRTQEHDPTENFLMCFVRNEDRMDIPTEIRSMINTNMQTGGVDREEASRPISQTLHTYPEWYTVHSIKALGAYLEHTPWYNFPYLTSIKTFWQVMFNGTRAVHKRYGFSDAYLCQYIIMNIIVGCIFSTAYTALGAAAFPVALLCKFFPDRITMRVVVVHDKQIDPTTFNAGITSLSKVDRDSDSVSYLRVPRYISFKNIAINMAKNNVDFALIARNREISVDISLAVSDENHHLLDNLDGCTTVSNYKVTPTSEKTNYVLMVDVKKLSQTIRYFDERNIEIVRISDY